jgi:hypothetical protein
MSVTWTFEKSEDKAVLDRFAEKNIIPDRKN